MDFNKRRLDEDLSWEEQRNKRMRTDHAGLEVGLLLMHKDVGLIMGKGGEKINSIRKESGARVNIHALIPNSPERIGNVTGNCEQVSIAVQLIATSICEERPTITLLAESRNLGPLIGKGGGTINKIRTETNANVDIGRECLGDSTQKEIRIEGNPESVSQAIGLIVKHLAEGKSPIHVPYEPYAGEAFNRQMMGRGGRGRGIRPRVYPQRTVRGGGFNTSPMFRDRDEQFIDVRDFDPVFRSNNPVFRGNNPVFRGRSVQYRGVRGSNLSRTQGRLSGLRIETTVYVPKDIVGKIIGRGGSSINSVRRQSGATIVIEESEENQPERKITIKGKKHSMDTACSMLAVLADS